MSLLLVLSLLLHAFGPLDGLPRKEGFAAICTGNGIVYIPLSSLGLAPPQDTEPAPKSDECPWFAQFHALEIDPATDGHDAAYFSPVHFIAAAAEFGGKVILNSSLARGPPRSAV